MTHLKTRTLTRHRLWMFSITLLVGIALLIGSANSRAQSGHATSFDVLQQLLRLDDQALQDRIDSDWSSIRTSLDQTSSSGPVRTRHRQGFAGPQQACLQTRAVAACRIYTRELVELQQKKEQHHGSLLLNPWAATPR